MEHRTVFLMYHELELPGRSFRESEPGYVRYVVSAADFHAQMQHLKKTGWRGVNVSEALRFAKEPKVVLTFDDGCETDLLAAAPLLLQLHFGATFYVTVGFIGRRGYMSAAQVRELADLGFEIGCHSMTHAYLTDLDEDGLNREVRESKVQLEQLLGRPIHHFSCPGGRVNERVVNCVRRSGYQSLANSRAFANSASEDRFALGRIPMMRRTPLGTLDALCHGRGLWQRALGERTRRSARILLGNSSYDRIRAAVLGQPEPRQ